MPEDDQAAHGDDERLLYGMDAEHAEKMRQKLIDDPKYERDALNWIESLTGETLPDCYPSLKSGVVLCKLVNAIKPNTIQAINTKPIALAERGNIKNYIHACVMLGVPTQELFDVSDLHDKKSLNSVIMNIYALGRAAQALEGYQGPILGVRYSVTIEEQKRRSDAKEVVRKREQEQYEEYLQERKKRREDLEDEKAARRVRREDTQKERIKTRRIKKGRRISNSQLPPVTGIFGVSPVKFGMDGEQQKLMEEKQMEADTEYEESALDWIESMTGLELDDIFNSLRSGVVLCQLANAIEPGVIPKINMKNLAPVHRENIQLYLNACVKWGMPSHELFTVPDLYERKMISSVVVNIYALARLVRTRQTRTPTPALMVISYLLSFPLFSFDYLNRGGKSVVISRSELSGIPKEPGPTDTTLLVPKEEKRSCCCTIL